MRRPYVYGFALQRILRDRRLTVTSKVAAVHYALDVADYGEDFGLPYGLLGGILALFRFGQLDVVDLRYALTLTAPRPAPFAGLERDDAIELMRRILAEQRMPPGERAGWAHTLLARHHAQTGASALVEMVAGSTDLPVKIRQELCRAWFHLRQPRFDVAVPPATGSERSHFVAEHMPFWMAHLPSWPTRTMVRLGLVWAARLGSDPTALIDEVLAFDHPFFDSVQAAVADILAEQHERMARNVVRSVIDLGIRPPTTPAVRRKFYRLGIELFGPEYLDRAASDSAGSVRRWAVRELMGRECL